MLPNSPCSELALALVLAAARPVLSVRDEQSVGEATTAEDANAKLRLGGGRGDRSVQDWWGADCYHLRAEGELHDAGRCRECARDSDCKWCVLSQRCVESGIFGDSCPQRPGSFEAYKVSEAAHCSTGNPEWVKVLNATLGHDWDRDSYLDAKRCVQWSLGWKVTPDPYFSIAEVKAMGSWACQSTLLRVGILAMLGGNYRPWPSFTQVHRKMTMISATNSSTGKLHRHGRDPYKTRTINKVIGVKANGDWYANTITWEPVLCSLIKVLIGKSEKCYVRAHNVESTEALRSALATPNRAGGSQRKKIAESIQAGPLVPLSPGAGKSSSVFARTQDSAYKVKLGLRYGSKMNEPKNFERLVNGGKDGAAPDLLQHLTNHKDSLLNRYYAMLKLRMGSIFAYVMLMGDAYYTMEEKVKAALTVHPKLKVYRYDLKGESRNQDERNDLHSFTLINGNFHDLEGNKLWLTEEQCRSFKDALAHDVAFLGAHHMIDYSLLVMSVHLPEPGALTCAGTPGKPFCMEHEDRMYTISLIDYLNNYNFYKKLESTFVKYGKFDDYGEKMMKYADLICPTTEEQLGASPFS